MNPDKFPEKPTLAEWQTIIKEMIAEKKWTTDPNEIFVLLVEEMGELAKELRKKWKFGAEKVSDDAGAEIADIFMYLMDMANHFNVDVETAVRRKIAKNEGRTWEF